MKTVITIVVLVVLSSILGCKKKEEAPAPAPAVEAPKPVQEPPKYPQEHPVMKGPKKEDGV